MLVDRRSLLKVSAIGGGALAATPGIARALDQAGAPASAITPPQDIGPFYPVVGVGENTVDLTRVPGNAARAQGKLVEIRGRVQTIAGKPVRGAIVLVWQANASGAYAHPRNGFGVTDPVFRGHGILRTDRSGEFSLLTIRPGAYPDMPGTLRTPHVHFEVIGEEGRLITQMYFPGEPLNDSDRLLRELKAGGGDPQRLIAITAPDSDRNGVARLHWTIVLERG